LKEVTAMADQTIHDETVVTSAAAADEILIWRAANNDTRRITKANFLGLTATGGGTFATGGFTLTLNGDSAINGTLAAAGFTLTVPATGTAALLGTAQTFSATQTFAALTASGVITANGQLKANDFLILTPETATIASGAITATSSLMVVDTEASAASDTLETINGGVDGAILIITQSNSSRDVTISMSLGNIRNSASADRVFTSNSFHWIGRYKASVSLWLEIAWSGT
jgi:hypothetical protein